MVRKSTGPRCRCRAGPRDHHAIFGIFLKAAHTDLLDVLGVDGVDSGKRQDLFGIEGKGVATYFHDVIIEIGPWRYKAFTGFTDYGMVNSPDQMSYGILGQIGFFEHFKVMFNHEKRELEIKPLTTHLS